LTLRDPSTITLGEATTEELIAAFQVKSRGGGEVEVLLFPSAWENQWGEPLSAFSITSEAPETSREFVLMGARAVIVAPLEDEELPLGGEA